MAVATIITGDEAKAKNAEDLFTQLDSSPQGLTSTEAETRIARYGPNALREKCVNPILNFLATSRGRFPG